MYIYRHTLSQYQYTHIGLISEVNPFRFRQGPHLTPPPAGSILSTPASPHHDDESTTAGHLVSIEDNKRMALSTNSALTSPMVLLLLCITILCSTKPSGAQTKVSDDHVALFIFGDSLYDVGMNMYYKKGTLGANPPYGENFFNGPTGRYSDGRLVPDFIAEYAGLPYLPPYLQPGLKNLTNGVNFAAAGACVLSELRPGTVNLKKQMGYFELMVRRLKKQMGDAGAHRLLSRAVYLFSIGGNDYGTLFSTHIDNPEALSPSYKRQYMTMVLANLTTHIKTVYNKGGRKFAFQNVGPIGCMPATKALYSGRKKIATCLKEPAMLARTHNTIFQAIANKLRNDLPGFKYSIYDYYTACVDRVVAPTKYGFKEGKTGCCGSSSHNGAFTCGSPKIRFKKCDNPSDHLWYDAAHHCEKANEQFARMFWEGGSDVTSPYNLRTLFNVR